MYGHSGDGMGFANSRHYARASRARFVMCAMRARSKIHAGIEIA